MADPVLPVVGVAIAAIGLLVNVRNGIDMIIRDKDRIKDFVITDVALAGSKVTILSNQLELWKRLWLITDHTPRTLFEAYWGKTGADRVHDALELTEHISREIESEFASKYGRVQAEAQERIQRSGLLAKHEQTSEGKRQKRLQARIDAFNLNYRPTRRARLVLFNSPTFQRHLKELQESIESLELLSVSEFSLHHNFIYDAEVAGKIGLKSHLIFLARAARSSVDLVEWCKRQNLPPTMAIDLHLDLAYGSMQPRHEYIAQRANQNGFPYYLRVCNDANVEDEDRYMGFLVENETKFESLKNHLEQLRVDHESGSDGDALALSTESMRNVLSIRHQNLLESLHHQFSLPERYKLAYEISESALVMLASTSFCELCVCTLRRYYLGDAENDHEYYIRVNNAHEELETPPGDVHVADRWCRRELLGMHIRRLGVVLTEICTGAVVRNVRYDPQSKEVRMTIIDGSDQSIDCSPEKVADLVKDAAGVDLSGAVYYCLRRDITPERVGEKDLLAFYNRVVAP
jgi:hypothetical protein